jgi:hypothetical protein
VSAAGDTQARSVLWRSWRETVYIRRALRQPEGRSPFWVPVLPIRRTDLIEIENELRELPGNMRSHQHDVCF